MGGRCRDAGSIIELYHRGQPLHKRRMETNFPCRYAEYPEILAGSGPDPALIRPGTKTNNHGQNGKYSRNYPYFSIKTSGGFINDKPNNAIH